MSLLSLSLAAPQSKQTRKTRTTSCLCGGFVLSASRGFHRTWGKCVLRGSTCLGEDIAAARVSRSRCRCRRSLVRTCMCLYLCTICVSFVRVFLVNVEIMLPSCKNCTSGITDQVSSIDCDGFWCRLSVSICFLSFQVRTSVISLLLSKCIVCVLK